MRRLSKQTGNGIKIVAPDTSPRGEHIEYHANIINFDKLLIMKDGSRESKYF